MMFDLDPADPRNRAVIADKVRAMLKKGPGGMLRLAKERNQNRLRPMGASRTRRLVASRPDGNRVWRVEVGVLDHEGGVAQATKPLRY